MLLELKEKFKKLKREFHTLCNHSFVKDSNIKVAHFMQGLQNCKDASIKGFILRGLQHGFELGLVENPTKLPQKVSNQCNSLEEKVAILEDFVNELSSGRIEAVNKVPLCVSPVSVIPKDTNKYRLIRNLSHPKGQSLNDNIIEDAKRVSYPSHKDISKKICIEGKSCFIARQDLKNAYRQLKMSRKASKYLGYSLYGRYLQDNYIVFGYAPACRIFQAFGIVIIIVFEDLYLIHRPDLRGKIVNYLDDFISIVLKHCDAYFLYDVFFHCLSWLGVEVNVEKCLPPSNKQKVLGLIYDTNSMTVSLPNSKVLKYTNNIACILQNRRVTRKALEELIGQLTHSSCVIAPGRAFLSKLRKVLYASKNDNDMIYVNDILYKDLCWWILALQHLNSKSLYVIADFNLKTIAVFTDACLYGIGAICESQHFSFLIPPWHFLSNKDIAMIECYAVAMAVATFAKQWKQNKVRLFIDSKHAGAAISKMKDDRQMMSSMVRFIAMQAVKFDFTYEVTWISSAENALADSLSRIDYEKFDSLCVKKNICSRVIFPCLPNIFDW